MNILAKFEDIPQKVRAEKAYFDFDAYIQRKIAEYIEEWKTAYQPAYLESKVNKLREQLERERANYHRYFDLLISGVRKGEKIFTFDLYDECAENRRWRETAIANFRYIMTLKGYCVTESTSSSQEVDFMDGTVYKTKLHVSVE